ncbi:conserved hypothetical protein [Pyrobaculum aerophilum str. IM2]|uniref:Uncharacterized protein n=1 Tax=Pyrobaculum aerophilum (strain ATCC 51768 / DSM 7523 / JCM 9630 / CIP 104966 / NBRC 100827 / IM2) TaxID=178306 RepID=Q8ZYR2_PYRAE|nr:V-type ATP synthase subunit E [Pyrobaculum aerophilum]AAL62931.1 conserved hypothetical protein [Pyrobaculum aerophilum str. IM2]
MSLFEDLIRAKIAELEELKKNLLVDIETRIRREAYALLNKFTGQITSVESEVTLERERIIYEALVNSRRKIAETYENLLKDLIDAVYSEIDKIRGTERYVKFLTFLIQNAINYIQSRDVIIYTSPKDRGVVEAIARSLGITGLISERDMRVGVVVTSRDGSVTVDYSLETIVANKLEELKHLLYLGIQ